MILVMGNIAVGLLSACCRVSFGLLFVFISAPPLGGPAKIKIEAGLLRRISIEEMEAPTPLLVALENETTALDLLHETMRPRYHTLQRLHQMNGDEYNKMTKQFNKMNNRQKLLKRWITIHNNPRLLEEEGREQIGHDVVDKYHDMVYHFGLTRKIKGASRLGFGNTV
jgi:hypothetical protein